MGSKKATSWVIIISIFTLIIGIGIGSFISGKSLGRKLFLTPNNKISVVLDIINQDYIDSIDMKELSENAISKIIDELDPHSSYIPSSELQMINEDMEGHFGGLGINYYLHKDTIVIVNITHGSPSSQAGLLPGDRIISANDSLLACNNLDEEKIANSLRGPLGSSIKLGIKHKTSEEIIEYNIQRGNIPLTTVKAAYVVEDNIGYIKIFDKFSHTTYDEFIQAVSKLTAQGCTSFIIDLRMNGGGSFDAAINIVNEFLPPGRMIVYAEGKSFPRMESISNGTGNLPESEVVILMDQLSASASEVVAGAIQDNDRGLIIGRRSFGKGLVQNQIELSDKSALRLTIARYFTPSGRNIQRKYDLGQSEAYNQTWIDQLNNGEAFSVDSIKIDSTLIYQTLNGRTVYGNGGIIPDIFVPIDTSHVTSYFIKLENHNIFEKYAFQFFDNNLHLLKEYKDYNSMIDYLNSQPVIYDFVRFAEENGIRRRSSLINRSAEQILLSVYAHILNNFFGEEAFYYVYMENDAIVKEAVNAILNGYSHPQSIALEEYRLKD